MQLANYSENSEGAEEMESGHAILSLTEETFRPLVLDGVGPIAVEFMSYGCVHCRIIEPALQEVAGMLRSSEKIYRVNIAADRALADSYEIQGTPTLIMFLDGRQVGRVEGPSPTVTSIEKIVTEPFVS
jgi:thioredoxin 1